MEDLSTSRNRAGETREPRPIPGFLHLPPDLPAWSSEGIGSPDRVQDG